MIVAKTRPQPILISLVALVFVGGCLLLPAMFVWTVFMNPDETIIFNGEAGPVSQFRVKMLAGILTTWLVCAPFAFGFWKKRKWLQPALMVYFSGSFALIALAFLIRLGLTISAAFAILAFLSWWYFYRKRSVVEYFDTFQR